LKADAAIYATLLLMACDIMTAVCFYIISFLIAVNKSSGTSQPIKGLQRRFSTLLVHFQSGLDLEKYSDY